MRRIGIGEPNALPGKLVDMRGFIEVPAIALKVPPSHIIHQDEYNVFACFQGDHPYKTHFRIDLVTTRLTDLRPEVSILVCKQVQGRGVLSAELSPGISIGRLLPLNFTPSASLNTLLFCGMDPGSTVSREQLLALYFAQHRLMFSPGDDCTYANPNYTLISLLIERVSGMTLAEFMQEELFKPLGMDATGWISTVLELSGHRSGGLGVPGIFQSSQASLLEL